MQAILETEIYHSFILVLIVPRKYFMLSPTLLSLGQFRHILDFLGDFLLCEHCKNCETIL